MQRPGSQAAAALIPTIYHCVWCLLLPGCIQTWRLAAAWHLIRPALGLRGASWQQGTRRSSSWQGPGLQVRWIKAAGACSPGLCLLVLHIVSCCQLAEHRAASTLAGGSLLLGTCSWHPRAQALASRRVLHAVVACNGRLAGTCRPGLCHQWLRAVPPCQLAAGSST